MARVSSAVNAAVTGAHEPVSRWRHDGRNFDEIGIELAKSWSFKARSRQALANLESIFPKSTVFVSFNEMIHSEQQTALLQEFLGLPISHFNSKEKKHLPPTISSSPLKLRKGLRECMRPPTGQCSIGILF